MAQKIFILAVGLLLSATKPFAQQLKTEIQSAAQSRTYLNASPQATAFGIYGQVPVSHFTGTPQINIPLYNIIYRELNVDLSLMYHQAIGNKPDLFPGYYGNGWLLTTGGVITRISKGERPYDDGVTPIHVEDYATLYDNWSDTSHLDSLLMLKKDIVGAFNPRYDEFSYNFGNYSGKFYMDDDDTIKIKTTQGEELKVKMEYSSDPIILPSEAQDYGRGVMYGISGYDYDSTLFTDGRQAPYRFTIVNSNGSKYTFGGTPEAMDISRPGNTATESINYDFLPWKVLPTSWYLTSIESPNGYKINLSYKRDTFYVTSEIRHSGRVYSLPGFGNLGTSQSGLVVSSTLFNPCYLDKIITPISTTQFYWSKADQQLRYKFLPPYYQFGGNIAPNSTSPYYFSHYPDVGAVFMQNRFPNKLDGFRVSSAEGKLINIVEFNYTSDTTTRLKLLNVKSKGNGNTAAVSEYKFEYNPAPLPDYLSMKTDKYGFYNGRNFFSYHRMNLEKDTLPQEYMSFFKDSASRRDSFIISKEPDSNFTKAEILEKVVYPTGGYTTYEYESNTCSKYIDSWPAAVVDYTADSITGGLRIRKISNYDYAGHKTGEKTYKYINGYASGGLLSSGVLTYKPVFYREYDNVWVKKPLNMYGTSNPDSSLLQDYQEWSTAPINPPNYNEPNFISYSEVTEINADSSFTVYKYQNHDNGFLDKPVVNMATDNPNIISWKGSEENSLSLERGLLYSEEIYNNTGVCKARSVYDYNDDSLRYNNHIRFIKAHPNILYENGLNKYLSLRYVAYLYYTYYPYLKKRTSYEYTTEGDSIVTESTNTYDANDRLLKTQTTKTSDDRVLLLQNMYPKDRVAQGQVTPYQDLIAQNITGTPVEQSSYIDSILINKAVVDYHQGLSVNTSLVLPKETKLQNRNGPLEKSNNFYVYDSTGNPLCFGKEAGNKTCIVWSYANSLPIAKIVNAEYSAVQSVLGGQQVIEDIGREIPTQGFIQSVFAQLRNSASLKHAFITTYTHELLVGVASETDPNGKTTYYQYDGMNRLSIVRDNGRNIIKKICYNYNGQPEECSIDTAAYVMIHLVKAGSPGLFCDENPLLESVVAYYPPLPADSFGLITPPFFYSSTSFTNYIPDGYYRPETGNNFAGLPLFPHSYIYIKNGKILYIGNCEDPVPDILFLPYSDTALPLTQICNAALPETTIFLSIPYWYANYSHSSYVANGYYIQGSLRRHVVNGVVVATDTCYSVDSVLMTTGSTINNACLSFDSTSQILYFKVPGISVGTKLYTDSLLTIPAPAGYYSNGGTVYTVDSSGTVTNSEDCFGFKADMNNSRPGLLQPEMQTAYLVNRRSNNNSLYNHRPLQNTHI